VPDDPNNYIIKVSRILLYAFFVMLVLGLLTVIIIMTRSDATLKKMEPKYGSLYDYLRYEQTNFARVWPVWFMGKRIAFVAMVFYFKNERFMILFVMYLYLFEIGSVLAYKPFCCSHD